MFVVLVPSKPPLEVDGFYLKVDCPKGDAAILCIRLVREIMLIKKLNSLTEPLSKSTARSKTPNVSNTPNSSDMFVPKLLNIICPK